MGSGGIHTRPNGIHYCPICVLSRATLFTRMCISASPTSTAYIMLKSELEKFWRKTHSVWDNSRDVAVASGRADIASVSAVRPVLCRPKSEGFSLMKQRSFRRCFYKDDAYDGNTLDKLNT